MHQMQRVDEFVYKRNIIAKRYEYLLSDLLVVPPQQHKDSYSAFHLYVIRLKLNNICKTHRQVFEAMRAKEVGVNLHYIPVYHHPYYQQMGFKEGYCPQAEQYYSEAISIPMYPGLTEKQQDEVVMAIRESI